MAAQMARPAAGGGTQLHLEHSGFTATAEVAFKMMSHGWRNNVNLARVLAEMPEAD